MTWADSVRRTPTWDQAAHLAKGLAFAQAMASGTLLHEFFAVPEHYPPGFHVLLAISMRAVGPSDLAGLYVNLAALGVLLAATYAIGARLSSRRAGLLAALLAGLYPGTALYFREALLEPLLAATVVVSILLLTGTRTFQDRRAALLLGLVLGIGLLVKPTFALYVWLPVGGMLIAGVRRDAPNALINAGLAALVALAVAACWYLPHRDGLVALARINREDAISFGHSPEPWDGLRITWWQLGRLMTPFGQDVAALAALVCVVLAARRWAIVLGWIVGPWALFAFVIIFRDEKYFVPVVPAGALVVAAALDRIRRGWIYGAAVVPLIALHAVAWSAAQFGWPALNRNNLLATGSWYAGTGGAEPAAGALVEMIGQMAPAPTTVAVITNEPRLNSNTLTWEARRRGLPIDFERTTDAKAHTMAAALRRIMTAEWVLLRAGPPTHDVATALAQPLSEHVRGQPDFFRFAGMSQMADGQRAELYSVTAPAVQPADRGAIAALLAASDPALRDLTFGGRFRLLAIASSRRDDGIVIRLGWEAVTSTPLDRMVAVHLVNDAGDILAGEDYPQTRRTGMRVAAGTRWVDEVVVPSRKLIGATGIGICLYHHTEFHLPIDRGPRDWNDFRLRTTLDGRVPQNLFGPVSR